MKIMNLSDEVAFRLVKTEEEWKIVLEIEMMAANASPYYLAFTNLDELKKFVGQSVVYLMYVGDMPAGHVEYERKNVDVAEITGFVLLPEYRGRGLGKRLFNRAMEDLNETKQVFLMTHPENSAALRVYLAAGFKIKAWKDNYYHNGQPRLRLELNQE